MKTMCGKLLRYLNILASYYKLLLAIFIISISIQSFSKLDGKKFEDDSCQNVISGYHLLKYGILSHDGKELFYRREPLPIAIAALYMSIVTDVNERDNVDNFINNGNVSNKLCSLNIVYIVFILLASYWLAFVLVGSHAAGFVAICCEWFLFYKYINVNTMLSDLPATLLIILASLCSVWFCKKKRIVDAAALGAVLGVLALTKAAALYISFGYVVVLIIAILFIERSAWRPGIYNAIIILLTMALVAVPWMIRNYMNFGDFVISQRGGEVLLIRAIKNQMTMDEFKGSFYVYAPQGMKRYFFENVLGYERKDLKPGGRYVRLIRHQPGDEEAVASGNVEAIVSYYDRAKAIPLRVKNQMLNQGASSSQIDKYINEMAIGMIVADPGRHLLMTIPFSWRGIWSYYGKSSFVINIVNLVAFLCLFFMPVISFVKKKVDMFVVSLLGTIYFIFHSLFTHFISRYSEPLIPLSIIIVITVLQQIISRTFIKYQFILDN